MTAVQPARREQILAEAAKLFARKGVAATTVREIGDAVGLLSGSLYHYFDSKESMVDEILSAYLNDLLDSYDVVLAEHPDDPRACLEGNMRASFRAMESHRDAAEIFHNDFNYLTGLPRFAYLKQTNDRIQHAGLDVIRAGVKEAVFRADLDPEVFYRFARDAMWLSVRWFRPGGKYSVEDLADAYIAICMEGFALDGGPDNTGGPRRAASKQPLDRRRR
jgi:TetR/AcrR family transcriptional regulator, cholesterol catabolism regulator